MYVDHREDAPRVPGSRKDRRIVDDTELVILLTADEVAGRALAGKEYAVRSSRNRSPRHLDRNITDHRQSLVNKIRMAPQVIDNQAIGQLVCRSSTD